VHVCMGNTSIACACVWCRMNVHVCGGSGNAHVRGGNRTCMCGTDHTCVAVNANACVCGCRSDLAKV